jgi:hypothetical protein
MECRVEGSVSQTVTLKCYTIFSESIHYITRCRLQETTFCNWAFRATLMIGV